MFDLWWRAGGVGGFPEFGRKNELAGAWEWVGSQLSKLHLWVLLKDVRQSYRAGRFFGGKTLELASGGQLQLVPSLLAQMVAAGQPDRREFHLVLDTLERLHTLATQHGTRCLILFLPSQEEVYLPWTGTEAADLAAPFLPELDKRGIPYLDLGPPFRQRAAMGKQLCFEIDGHPNAQAYALIAEAVVAYLREKYVVNQ